MKLSKDYLSLQEILLKSGIKWMKSNTSLKFLLSLIHFLIFSYQIYNLSQIKILFQFNTKEKIKLKDILLKKFLLK